MNQNASTTSNLRRYVIVGGGSAGWMTASLLSKLLHAKAHITVLESAEIASVGVGEATIPPIQFFNNYLGLKEHEFLRATEGTYKLGIQFENWGRLSERYMHAFGPVGGPVGLTPFYQYWLKARKLGIAGDLWDHSYNFKAAADNGFCRQRNLPGTQLPGLIYAYHFDAAKYARLLQQISIRQGVIHIEGKVERVVTHPQSGNIEHLVLSTGQRVEGDLFIDCSGFKGLLIEQTLRSGYDDWSHWLPCDSAIAVQSEGDGVLRPYTRAIAEPVGWQWRIPLQQRTGNGYVYASRYLSDEQARSKLLESVDGKLLNSPRKLTFTTGMRKHQWVKNCVAIGLSSGFLEPLESTSLHLVQQSIIRLVKFLSPCMPVQAEIDEFNRQSKVEMERIRDFIILHYYLNQRDDSAFWRDCQTMVIPESLAAKIDLFSATGKFFRQDEELFTEPAWLQVMVGQNRLPEHYHPLVDLMSEQQLVRFLNDNKKAIQQAVSDLPSHQDFLSKLLAQN